MEPETSNRSMIPSSFGANSIVHMLAAGACFLAAYVIPLTYPNLSEFTGMILAGMGVCFLLLAVITVIFRRWLSSLAHKLGIRSRMMLPREGMVYLGMMLIIAIGALTGGNPDTGNMLLLVFGMMAGPFVLNGWVVVAMLNKVSVARFHPTTASAGSYFSVEVTLRNDKQFLSSRVVEVRDVIEGHRLQEEPTVTFIRVGPQEERTGTYELCIPRRGLYQLGPLRISSRFPLGIGERGHTISGKSDLVVHPSIGRLLPGWKRRERELAESSSRANARMGVFDDEFHSIREYRPGDSPRAIHWRSSARQGRMMVKEHQQHREAELIILLDLFPTREFAEDLQELSISLAATLCVEQTRHASSGLYRLWIAGRELVTLEVTGGSRFRDMALRSLATCEASPKASLTDLLNRVSQTALSANSRLVLLTPRSAEATKHLELMARENSRNDAQLLQRMLIVSCDQETLADVYANTETTSPALPVNSEDTTTARVTTAPEPGVAYAV
jgi:uncharacterized protein (DUF58 family)